MIHLHAYTSGFPIVDGRTRRPLAALVLEQHGDVILDIRKGRGARVELLKT